MIASMWNLDHRLAELRPSEAELRVARQLRDAATGSADNRPARSIDVTAGHDRVRFGGKPTRIGVG